MVDKVGYFKQVIASREQRIQKDSKSLIYSRPGVQLAMRRLMGQTETKLHEKGEGNGTQCRNPESSCVGSGPEEGERKNDLPYGQNRIQCSGDRVLDRVGLMDKVSLRYRLAEDASIGIVWICYC